MDFRFLAHRVSKEMNEGPSSDETIVIYMTLMVT